MLNGRLIPRPRRSLAGFLGSAFDQFEPFPD